MSPEISDDLFHDPMTVRNVRTGTIHAVGQRPDEIGVFRSGCGLVLRTYNVTDTHNGRSGTRDFLTKAEPAPYRPTFRWLTREELVADIEFCLRCYRR